MNKDITPTVSVIIPAYNVEQYIHECLKSVQNQTIKNYEVIIINDGSTDRTKKIISKFTEEDNRFKLFSQPNKGPSISRNLGISVAQGKFIYFLDADDSIHPKLLEACIDVAQERNLDIVHFNGSVHPEPISKLNHFESDENYIRDLPEYPKNFYKDAVGKNQYRCSICLYLIRSEFLKKSGVYFIPGILHEDECFTLKVINLTKKQGFLKESFYRRRIRPESIMTSLKSADNYEGYFQTFCDLSRWLPKSNLAFPENRYMLKKHIAMFYLIALRGFVKYGEIRRLRLVFFQNLKAILYYVPIKAALAPIFPVSLAKHLIK